MVLLTLPPSQSQAARSGPLISGYSLDRDGDANLEKSIVDQLADS